MQKKLIALAVAGLMSAPAMAQSNVTIFGVVDAGVVYGSGDDNKFRGVQSGLLSASRLGFKGTEDLGNGLTAKFHLEYGISVDSGGGPTGARQSWVGLEGGFGFVGLGRQYSPGHNIAGMNDNFGGSSAFSPYALMSGAAGSSIVNGGPGRWNNAVNYKSKSFSGFKFEGIYAFGENADQDNSAGNRDAGNRYGLGGSYNNGPIKAGLVYHRTDGGSADDKKEWMVTGGYNFGVATVAAHYLRVKVGGDTNKVWDINAKIPVSEAGNVLIGYADLNADNSDGDASAWTLAYTHSLSKRTTAYAGYRRVSNDDLAAVSGASGLQGELGENNSGFTVGVRHTF